MKQLVLPLIPLARALGLALLTFLVSSCGTKPPYEGKSLAELEEMLGSSEEATQVQGEYGLGLLGDRAGPAVPALAELLHSPHVLVRQNAALALGKIGPAAREAVPGLIQTLADRDWRVRRQAAMALGEIGPEARRAVPQLQKLRRDLPPVRRAAEDSLARIAPTTR